MTHLRDIEFVDALDGALPPARMAHLRSCAACRAVADGLRVTLSHASASPADEPSPLFWHHFAAGVNQRIDEPQTPASWFTRPRLAVAALVSVTGVLLVIALLTSARPVVNMTGAPPSVATTAPAQAIEHDDLDADTDWAIIRAAAEDLDLDDARAAGLAARPGTADRLVMELSEAERAELIRLVQSELKTGA